MKLKDFIQENRILKRLWNFSPKICYPINVNLMEGPSSLDVTKFVFVRSPSRHYCVSPLSEVTLGISIHGFKTQLKSKQW